MTARTWTGRAGLAAACCLTSQLALSAAVQSSDLQAVLDRLAAQEAALTKQQEVVAQQQRDLEAQRQEIVSLRQQLQAQVRQAPESGQARQPTASQVAVVPYEPSTASSPAQKPAAKHHGRELEISGYGIVNYFNRDWDTDEFAKDTVDTERFIVELEYQYNEQWKAVAELEYEHGGTGATLEFDSQEEFGEFEQEVENGGEVTVEELFIAYQYEKWANARVGRFIVPVGRTNVHHKPQDYFTVARSEADAAMIPQVWSEDGLSGFGTWSFGDWGRVHYEA
jgi:hypothetical protein